MKTADYIVFPDMHVRYGKAGYGPYHRDGHNEQAVKLVLDYAKEHKWAGIIQLGDFLDFKEISKYEDQKKEGKEGAIENQYVAGKHMLDRILEATRKKNPHAVAHVIEGNHEARVAKYLERHPELRGSIEVPVGLGLASRNVEWHPFWTRGTVLRVGKANFIHGRYHNLHHAAKHLNMYPGNTYYGHLHTLQVASRRMLGRYETNEAACLGTLCAQQDYLAGAPVDWQLAFAVFRFEPKTGWYQRYMVRIVNGRFISPEGKAYGW